MRRTPGLRHWLKGIKKGKYSTYFRRVETTGITFKRIGLAYFLLCLK
jgi:hypothetical protein